MKNRGLTIAAVVLIGLLGFLYWSNRHPPADKSTVATPTPSEPAPKILAVNEEDITKVEIKKKGDDPITITRDSNGTWQITAPKATAVDESAISSFLSNVSTLDSERLVEEKPANLSSYGLSDPRLEIDLTEKNGASHKILVGDDTPTSSGAYAQLGGDARVFTIASFVKTNLDKNLADLRDKRLITAAADKITRVEFTSKQQTIEFGRDKEQWQILKPRPLRAESTAVDELVRQVTTARMDLTPQPPPLEVPSPSPSGSKSDKSAKAEPSPAKKSDAATSFNSGSQVATVRVTTDSGTQQIEVRKNKDDYFAKSSISDGVYKVTPALGQELDKKLDDFRDKKVFDLQSLDISKVEIRDGAKDYSLTKSGNDWQSADGKKYAGGGVLALLDKLCGMEATEFSDSASGETVLQVTLTSGDGKRTERASVLKGAKNSIARREGDSSSYVMDSGVIGEIQKLLSELKSS